MTISSYDISSSTWANNTTLTTASALNTGLLEIKGQELTAVDAADYRELQDERLMLEALNEAGVEEWEGYGQALEIYRERKGQS